MTRRLLPALLLLCAAAQAQPAAESVAEAERLGRLLLRYDQAAWHGTDAALPLLQADGAAVADRVTGYVVAETPDGWRVAFGKLAADSLAFRIAYEAVLDTAYAVVGATAHDPAVAERGFMLRAKRAQDAAAARFQPRVRATYNTAVLPGPDGAVYVYYLPAQPADRVYVLGGDVRFTVGAGGRVLDERDLHGGPQVFDLRAPQAGPTVSAGAEVVETDVFYAMSRPLPTDGAATHLVTADGWVVVLGDDGVLEQTTRAAYEKAQGRPVKLPETAGRD